MSETATFSSSGEEAITRQIDISDAALPQDFSADGLNDYFDIDRTVNEIIQHNYKRVSCPLSTSCIGCVLNKLS